MTLAFLHIPKTACAVFAEVLVYAAMELKDFIKTIPFDQRDQFAQQCGVSLVHLRHCAWGARKRTAELAIRVEFASRGAVRAESLRPDLADHFQFLRASKG